MRRIWIENVRKYAIVDDEDYDRVSQHRWRGQQNRNRMYCQTGTSKGSTVNMQYLIMGKRMFLIDGNGFNCRKSNFSFYKHDIVGKMTEDLKGFILGTLLGDASVHIYKNKCGEKRFSLSVTHGEDQRDYIVHKSQLLSSYIRTGPRRSLNTEGFGGRHYRWQLCTRVTSDFGFLHMCYNKKGKKHVSQAWVDNLTLISLAYWYMDDGTLRNKKYVKFCTYGFSIPECTRLVKKLQKMGFTSKILFSHKWHKGSKRNYPYIIMDHLSSRKFLKEIDHLIVECLKYKSEIIEILKETKCDFCGDAIRVRGKRANSKWKSCSRKECRAAHNSRNCKEWHDKNLDHFTKYQKNYRAKNRQRIKEYKREYHVKNREHINQNLRRKRHAKQRKTKRDG